MMNIVTDLILPSLPESLFVHLNTPDKLSGLTFNMADVFPSHISFEEQYTFFKAYFWPWIIWSRLQLAIFEVKLFFTKINTLRKDHEIEGRPHIKS